MSILSGMVHADTRKTAIVDDAALNRAVADVRNEFLQGKPFDRLDVAILIPNEDGTWRRGSHNPEALAYPASCVKLPYLAAAMHWCRTNNLPPEHLDHCVRPMIEKSDNVQTGVVIDAITSTTCDNNSTTSDARFMEWLDKRRYVNRYMDSLGLLENQVLVHKTYPTNSGNMPEGYEKLAREICGMNEMQPKCAASLMLEIATKQLEPQAHAYMMDVLDHDIRKSNSVFGWGMPPGTKYYNKPGYAYDILADIAYAVLPNGRTFVIAGFSQALCPPYTADPDPYGRSQLGYFCEMLLERTGLLEGCPPVVKVDNLSADFSTSGTWTDVSGLNDAFGGSAVFNGGDAAGSATWRLKVPKAGRYEVSAWYPQSPAQAQYVVRHAEGEAAVPVDQQKVGGRWFKLGDYRFAAGKGEVELLSAGGGIAADAVKAAMYP